MALGCDEINVLMLQGPPSPFARDLGAALRSKGASVWRINLCIGDWIYWHGPDTINYRGSLKEWGEHLEDFIRAHAITDIVYFADQFPYHRIARSIAEKMQINAISYEYGYLRPDWIVVEPGGQSRFSHFTQDLDRIRAAAKVLPSVDFKRRYFYDFKQESRGDVVYHLLNYLLWFLYPQFQRDRVYNPVLEYLSYIRRFRRARRNLEAAESFINCIRGTRYFVVVLQMQNDYQIRNNSPYPDQRLFLKDVLSSFAAHAPVEASLVVKVHPLDNGLKNWESDVGDLSNDLAIEDRVSVLDGGDLDELTKWSSGMITINSTSAIGAIRQSKPIKVLGHAVYDMSGLTFQGQLNEFWQGSEGPTEPDVSAFLSVLATYAHIRGDFYGPEGRAAAVEAFADRLLSRKVWAPVFDQNPSRSNSEKPVSVQNDY